MVQDRKEPTMNTITPDRDEILTHQNRMGKNPAGPRPGASRPMPVKRSALGGIALIAAIIAVVGAGVVGWRLWETQQQFAAATLRIVALETQLDLNNNKSSQSVDNIFERLATADSEIAKLWGVSYDTNRRSIAINKDEITAVSGRLNDAAAAAKAATDALATISSQANEQQLVVNRVVEDVNIQEQQLKQLNELAERIETITKRLETRMSNSEEAIEAIDAFRRSANRDIQQLKQQLSGPVGPG